jgi:NAD(P)-dependent dehydrogenase (short-subunit alcohol dehydrogenase family)
MTDRLKGRTAIITGAGQGIGAQTAQRFVEEGARVVIAELNPETGEATAKKLRDKGYPAMAVQTDVADQKSIRNMVERTVQEFGPPDILVNNAGIAVFSDPLSCTEDDWRRCFAVDLDGVWYGCQAVLPHMLSVGRGSIVNIASVHSFQIIHNCFPYPVAKHGVIGLTRALAVDYGAKNIRVNAICPSYISTQISIDYWNSFPDPAAERRRAEELHPIKRVGTPDEIAWTVVFLASDEAGFITGASIMADGGLSILYHP